MDAIQKWEGNKDSLPVVEEFYSIQGEGFHTGKPAYFLRIGGCDVGCSWCDTKFSWNADLHPLKKIDELVDSIVACPAKSVVVTGGEPLLFNLDGLCEKLKKNSIQTFLETSGTHPVSGTWDWLCFSPKRNMPPREEFYKLANELKVIVAEEADLIWAEECREKCHTNCELFLQPEWSKYQNLIHPLTEYVKNQPHWKISLQAHKFMHIP